MSSMNTPFDLDFLEWLGQFAGTWSSVDGIEHYVWQRLDGWLAAWEVESCREAPVSRLLDEGEKVANPPDPLGLKAPCAFPVFAIGEAAADPSVPSSPRPIVLSHDLMRLWLTPKEFDRLRNAWRVGTGMRMIVEALERRAREMDDEERSQILRQQWALWGSRGEGLSPEDEALFEHLWAKYQAGSAPSQLAT